MNICFITCSRQQDKHCYVRVKQGRQLQELQSEFRKVQIDIPDIENQRKIGGILRRLDDKIAVNDNINKNLVA